MLPGLQAYLSRHQIVMGGGFCAMQVQNRLTGVAGDGIGQDVPAGGMMRTCVKTGEDYCWWLVDEHI